MSWRRASSIFICQSTPCCRSLTSVAQLRIRPARAGNLFLGAVGLVAQPHDSLDLVHRDSSSWHRVPSSPTGRRRATALLPLRYHSVRAPTLSAQNTHRSRRLTRRQSRSRAGQRRYGAYITACACRRRPATCSRLRRRRVAARARASCISRSALAITYWRTGAIRPSGAFFMWRMPVVGPRCG